MDTTKLADPNVITLLRSARIDLEAAANLLPPDGRYSVNDVDNGAAITRYLGAIMARANQALAAVQSATLIVETPALVLTEAQQREKVILALISDVYNNLSPENLCCDGELRGRALLAKRKRLDVELEVLFEKLGRRVGETECYEALTALSSGSVR